MRPTFRSPHAARILPLLLLLACSEGGVRDRDPLFERKLRLDLLSDSVELKAATGVAGRGMVRPASTWGGGFTARTALVTTPGATISFPVVVEVGTALEYAVAVDAGAAAAGAAGMRFRVLVEGEEAARHDCVARLVADELAWTEGEIDLTRFAGRTVTLTLASAALPGGAASGFHGGWSPLRLVSRRPLARRSRDADHPSVLVFLVDTLRADAVSAYGNPRELTPRLDALAGEGLLFERAIAPSSWTLPSVASLFTGLGPFGHGAFNQNRTRLVEEYETLAETLLREGVSTAAFVRNPLITRSRNFDQGFETFYEGAGGKPGDTWAALLDWMRERRGDQCFAYVHMMTPHQPYAPPPEQRRRFGLSTYTGRYPNAGQKLLWTLREELRKQGAGPDAGGILTPQDVRHFKSLYEAEVAFWDESFGELLDALEAEGLLEDTLIVVTSDHGEEFLEHGLLSHGQQLFEELVRVPLVVWGPGIEARRIGGMVPWSALGPTVQALAGLTPDAPTLLELADEPASAPVLLGSDSGQRLGVDGMERVVALRTERWKLVWWATPDRYELYDLEADPAETSDLLSGRSLADLPEDAFERRLAAELQRLLELELAVQPENFEPADEATLAALEALGYTR